jgi:hypothetical protein
MITSQPFNLKRGNVNQQFQDVAPLKATPAECRCTHGLGLWQTASHYAATRYPERKHLGSSNARRVSISNPATHQNVHTCGKVECWRRPAAERPPSLYARAPGSRNLSGNIKILGHERTYHCGKVGTGRPAKRAEPLSLMLPATRCSASATSVTQRRRRKYLAKQSAAPKKILGRWAGATSSGATEPLSSRCMMLRKVTSIMAMTQETYLQEGGR